MASRRTRIATIGAIPLPAPGEALPPDIRSAPAWADSRAAVAVQLLVIVALSVAVSRMITPGQVLGADAVTKLLFLARMGLLLLVATVFLRLRGLRWRDMGLRRVPPRTVGFWTLGGLVASVALVSIVHEAVHHAGGSAPDYSMFQRLKGDLPEYLYWGLPVTLGSAAFGEEMIFRGFVRDALQRLMGPHARLASPIAIALQAAVFGFVHLYQGWGGVMTAGTIGLVLGFVWLGSGRNLWACIAIHGVMDLTSMTAIFLAGVPGSH